MSRQGERLAEIEPEMWDLQLPCECSRMKSSEFKRGYVQRFVFPDGSF